MTTSGGNGGSDDWGWSTEPGPEAQAGNGNPYEGNAPDTADTAAHATSTAHAPAKSGGNDFAKPMSGQYSGEVSQVGIAAGARSATYAALIEIADDASTIDYPELNCSGRLVFEGMQGNKAVYREVLSEGVGRCDDGGTWWFSGSYHELTGRYVPASSRYESTGTFYRETWSRGDDTSEQW